MAYYLSKFTTDIKIILDSEVNNVQFGIPSILKKKISSSTKEYTEALELYLDGIKSDFGVSQGHKVLRCSKADFRKAGIYDTIQRLPEGIDEKNQENGKIFQVVNCRELLWQGFFKKQGNDIS